MTTMTALELLQWATSAGILTGAAGIWRWVLRTERRLMVLEVKNNIKPG